MYTDDTLEVPSEEEREEVPDLPQTSETVQPHAVAVAKRFILEGYTHQDLFN